MFMICLTHILHFVYKSLNCLLLPAIKIILQFWSINILIIHVAVNTISMFLEQ